MISKDYITHMFVWLQRIPHTRGFGIQSPTDYAFVREVINEHGLYYAYEQLDRLSDDWLFKKKGKLFFRLANWRQPSLRQSDVYDQFCQAGCVRTKIVPEVQHVELGSLDVSGDYRAAMENIYHQVDDTSVLVIDNIRHDMNFWHEVETDPRTGVTFDLCYCGIVFFDKKRHKMNYKVNF